MPERRKDIWQGSERRSTLFIASMDIKTAFNVGNVSKHVAKMWVDKTPMDGLQQLHYGRWKGLKGSATFENVESKFEAHETHQGCVAWMTMKTHREHSTECRFEKTSTSWDTTIILRVEHKKAWKNGCTELTKRMVERRKDLQ